MKNEVKIMENMIDIKIVPIIKAEEKL